MNSADPAGLLTQQLLAFEWPSPTYIFGAIVFGLVGIVAWRRGRTLENRPAQWLGAALMLFPYAVSNTWLLYLVGTGLCAAVWWSLKT
jgi:hypothetical protein